MYVVSKNGTFGVLARRYRNEDNTQMVVIRWGLLRWLTPVKYEDILLLSGSYELDARAEAERWLADNDFGVKETWE